VLQRHDEALADLDRAIEINPDHPWGWQLKGGLLARMGRHEEAEKVLTKAIEMAPHFATIWYNRGAVRSNLGRRKEAIPDFQEAIRLNHPKADEIRGLIQRLRQE
jgi:tetratricopeptide (TPR) repeat protein